MRLTPINGWLLPLSGKAMEIINNANEKFKDKQDVVVGCLIELLGLLNELERSANRCFCDFQEKIPELSAAEISSCSDKLWADYHEECRKIIEGRCTERLLERGYGGSFSDPPKYGYIEDDCRGTFLMDTAKKAVVEFRFTRYSSVRFIHRFTLVPTSDGDKWLVDSFNHGTEKEGVWHRGKI